MIRLKKQYTKEEKIEYLKSLRNKWIETKKQLTNGEIDSIKAVIKTHGLNISYISYFMVSHQMKALGLDGIPYLDCKTFQGWKENGYIVKKGEKSKIDGITWLTILPKDENGEEILEEEGYVLPKAYHLFHKTQVEPLIS